MLRVLVLAVCGGGLRLVECGEGLGVSRVVRAGLGLDVYIILFISTVTVVLSLFSID